MIDLAISKPFPTPHPRHQRAFPTAWQQRGASGCRDPPGSRGAPRAVAGAWACDHPRRWAGRVEASAATPARRAARRARDSRLPGTGPAAGVGSARGWSWQALLCRSCLHSFLTLLGRSFLLLSTYYFIACFPPASPTPRNAPLHKSFLVLLLRASGALLPAWLVPKSRFHHQQQPVSKASYSKWAVLGYPSFGVPSWATVETDPLTRRALRQASL